MTGNLITALIVSAAWLFNIICWGRGFYKTAKCFSSKDKNPLKRVRKGLTKAFVHFAFTLADLGGVGLVRYLIGTYAAAILPSSIIAIGISAWLIILRKRFDKGLPLMGNTTQSEETSDDEDEEDYEEVA